MEVHKALEASARAADDGTAVTDVSIESVSPHGEVMPEVPGRPLFDEFYDDWAAFDAAIARAMAAYHPIRKRSSLTFEVYNRTVSKGRHDRKIIAEFLSKTFKCTHGIKFRSRGSGKRMRHKLRDIGCPFHIYASAVEFGPTYRVKVRIHDKHNHSIGPDSMKMLTGAFNESDYELVTHDKEHETTEAAASEMDAQHMEHGMGSAETAYERHMREEFAEAEAQHMHVQAHARAVVQADVDAQSQAYHFAQTQVLLKAQAEVQAITDAHVQARAQALLQHTPTQPQSQSVDAADILSGSGNDSETLLDGAIDSTMGDDVFSSSAAVHSTTSDVAVAVTSTIPTTGLKGENQGTATFEPTMTLESLRKRIADFADERDWNQVNSRFA
ncbi:hypothetical protein PsorP6_017983 [Peronosclerospora sorghi]|uniref:Uncharacterized protein n=1 Tax=Peronosclerospora sorghi TaxID=230839 RepID=A0ACC0WD59_9STRA|nr:hypothetical protein PsorP6_017983 [Peronosclerospora sorghi]